jgi:hypothetical protein
MEVQYDDLLPDNLPEDEASPACMGATVIVQVNTWCLGNRA